MKFYLLGDVIMVKSKEWLKDIIYNFINYWYERERKEKKCNDNLKWGYV